MAYLEFRKEKRYYNLHIQQSLFGTQDVICSWGAVGSKRNGNKIITCSSKEAIETEIKRITKLRIRRGYQICQK